MTVQAGFGSDRAERGESRAAFGLFYTSFLVSAMGDAFRLLAVNVWIFTATSGSTGARLLVVLLANLPGMLLGGLSGVIADRYDKYNVLVVSDLVRTGVGLGLAWCALDSRTVPALVLIAVGNGVGVFFNSSSFSLLPRLVSAERLPRANGFMETGQWVVQIVGPSLAAITLATGSASLAFVVDSASFVVSAVILRSLRRVLKAPGAPGPLPVAAEPGEDGEEKSGGHWADFPDGVRIIRRSRDIRALLLASYGIAFLTACTSYGLIFVVARTFALDASALGYIYSLNGVVAVIAAVLATALAKQAFLGRLMAVSMLGLCVAQVVMGVAPNIYVLGVGVAVSALANAPYNVSVTSLFMSRIPAAYLGRVEGIDTMIDNFISVCGFVAASVIVMWWNPQAVFLISAAVALPSLVLALRHMAGESAE
ncbi:Transmembrane secretion effector [Streptomyces sp. 2131.1]|uniref:MFS transporter n=1 Tax=Streptomyces sp. 2131.1 TaxID=1855346 RepID=UPI00089BDE1A|nr:MFS transporter [Streptomyces sp. 2131.1]SED84218.1 Transmembrane secretion effector [Streptomyces sp. 2131.1]